MKERTRVHYDFQVEVFNIMNDGLKETITLRAGDAHASSTILLRSCAFRMLMLWERNEFWSQYESRGMNSSKIGSEKSLVGCIYDRRHSASHKGFVSTNSTDFARDGAYILKHCSSFFGLLTGTKL
jgi:hypothetical protein